MLIRKQHLGVGLVLALVIPSILRAQSPNDGWTELFDGKTLEGWVQRGGKANYQVENGEIVGTTVPKTPNSFLCTEKNYSNFQLELEFKVDPRLNSGIQIRSNSIPEFKKGRVHGYQVEIDPSNRAYTAGIYDEARRGWLNPLKDNRQARYAFRQDAWNRLRVEAIGSRIRTWLNDVPAADLTDEMTKEGFIALQVHGVGGRKDPLAVRWRKIRIRETDSAWPENRQATTAPLSGSPFQAGTLKQLGKGYRFLEGPAVGPQGKIYFNDIPQNHTHVLDPETGNISIFREPSNRANGMFWTPNDYLISCEGGSRTVTQTSRGEQTTLAAKYDGKRLNSPNDLVLDAVGGIYFTDPRYGNRDDMEMSIEGVYYLGPKGKLSRIAEDLTRPNGLIMSPDNKILYVADNGASLIWAYDIQGNGVIGNKRKFADVGSDGMSVDTNGNVYCTHDGQVIGFAPDGSEVGRLKVPENPANCLIVGQKMYITARTGLYVVDMNVQGLAH